MKRRSRFNERLSRLEGQVDILLERSSDTHETSSALKSLAERVELVTKMAVGLFGAVAGAGAILYAVGYVIVNSHFLSFGIRIFDLTHPSYLVSGVVFVLFHTSVFLFPTVFVMAMLGAVGLEKSRSLSKRMALYVLTMLGILVIGLTFYEFGMGALVVPRTNMFSVVTGLGVPRFMFSVVTGLADLEHLLTTVFTLICIAVFLANYLIWRGDGAKTNWWLPGVLAILGIPIVVIATLISWSDVIYPAINPAFGGGQPVTVQLVLHSSEANGTPGGLDQFDGLEVDEGVTEPVGLLDESPSSLVIVLESGDAIRVSRSAVEHVIYLSEGDLTKP